MSEDVCQANSLTRLAESPRRGTSQNETFKLLNMYKVSQKKYPKYFVIKSQEKLNQRINLIFLISGKPKFCLVTI